jgi:hypothetical protein
MASPEINESQLDADVAANTLLNIRQSMPNPSDIGIAVDVLLGFSPPPPPPRSATDLLARVAETMDEIPETVEAATERKQSARIRLRNAKTEKEGRDAAVEFLQSLTSADMLRLGFEKERIMGIEGTDKVDPYQVVDIDADDTPVLSDDKGKINQENAEHIVPPFDPAKYVDFDYSKDIATDEARKEMMDGFELRKLTEMAYALFGRTGIEMITTLYDRRHNNKAAAIRTFFEGFAGDQCVGALTDPRRRFKPGKSLCWICGFVIPEPKTAKSGYKMECEHVFPIAQAVYFVDLYRGKGKVDPNSKSKLDLEYDWSHRVCNQIKNNKHFIKAKGGLGTKEWIIADDAEFTEFLQDIRLKSGLYFKGERNLLEDDIAKYDGEKGKGAWLRDSVDRVRSRCVETLNVGVGGIYAGIFDLIQVAKLLDMYDTEVPIRKRLNDALEAKNPGRSKTVPPKAARAASPAPVAPSSRAVSAPVSRPAAPPPDADRMRAENAAYSAEIRRQKAMTEFLAAKAANDNAEVATARLRAAIAAQEATKIRAAFPEASEAGFARAMKESRAAEAPPVPRPAEPSSLVVYEDEIGRLERLVNIVEPKVDVSLLSESQAENAAYKAEINRQKAITKLLAARAANDKARAIELRVWAAQSMQDVNRIRAAFPKAADAGVARAKETYRVTEAPPAKKFKGEGRTARGRKNGSVVTRSRARRTRRNAKQPATRD